MKTILIILCAFLLKTEADAQTWWNISPQNMDVIKKMQAIRASDRKLHLLVNSDTTVYSLVDGKKWNSAVSISENCMVQYKPYYEEIRFVISSIIPTEDDSLLIVYDGFACGSIDGSKSFFLKTSLNDLFVYQLDTLFISGGYAGSKNLVLYDSVNKEKYLLLADWGKVYFTEFDDNGYDRFKMQELQLNRLLELDRAIGDLFVLDSRNSEVYISVFTDSTCLYKRSLHDTLWNIIAKLPIIETQSYKPKAGFYELSFHSFDTNLSFISTDSGLWRYNDSTKKTDTLLKIPTRSIFFKENSDIAYVGTESGEIYRSTDAGETWSLFASGFSTKPVIGIYASGNDSLIVGTEDGIWTNYTIPVSVAEEIPFKNNELIITPNPANSSLKISFLKTELPQKLSVYNSLGQSVFKTEFFGEFVWDFKNDIPDGVYTVVVQSGGKCMAKQVMIVK